VYSGYVIVCFLEEVMAAPEQKRHESREEYLFRISSAEEKARISHRQRVAAGEVPPPEGRGPGTHPGYERDFPPSLPPEPEDPSLQGTDPVLDALLWGSAVGPLAKTGVQALPRMLRNKMARPYYHGTTKTGFSDIKPFASDKVGPIWMANDPRGWPKVYARGPGGRIFKKYIDPAAKVVPRRLHGTPPIILRDMGYHFLRHPKPGLTAAKGQMPGKTGLALSEKAFLPPGGLPMPKKPRILPRLLPIAGTQR
jgi:hypothetical protein